MRILIFGASSTQGFFDREGGWVQRLASEYHMKTLASLQQGGDYKVQVFNLGVSANRAEDIANRLEAETKARISPSQDTIIVFTTGANDSRMQNNRALVDVYEFQDEVEKIIKRARQLADKILCVGLSAVDEARTNPSPFSDKGDQWTNTRVNAFEDTLKQCAQHADIPFVPIHDNFLAQLESGADLLADGLHPDEAGHQLIAELVKPALDKLIAKN